MQLRLIDFLLCSASTSKFIFDTNERIELDPTVLVQEMHYEVGTSIYQEVISPCQPALHLLTPLVGLAQLQSTPIQE
jgi:hypothetical protein